MDDVRTLKIFDRELRYKPLWWGLRAELEREVVAARNAHWRRTLPVVIESLAGYPDDLKSLFASTLANRLERFTATKDEVAEYMNTTRGAAHVLHAMIRDFHGSEFPDIDSVERLIGDQPIEMVQRVVDEANAENAVAAS